MVLKFFSRLNFWTTLFSKITPNFWWTDIPRRDFKTFSSGVCWFLAKNPTFQDPPSSTFHTRTDVYLLNKRKTVIFDLLGKYSHLLSLFLFCFLTAHKWMRYVKFFLFHFFLSKTWRITILGWFFSVWFFDWVDCFFFPKSLRGLTFLPAWISHTLCFLEQWVLNTGNTAGQILLSRLP